MVKEINMKKFSEWLEERDPELYVEFASTVMGGIRKFGKAIMPYVAGASILGMGLGMGGNAHAGEPTQSNKPAAMKVAYGGDGGGGGESLDQLYQKAQKLIDKKSATKPGTDEYRKLAVETEDAINDYLNAKKAQESGGVKPVGAGDQKAPQPKVDDGQSAKKVQPSEPVAGGEQQKTLDMMSPEYKDHVKKNRTFYDELGSFEWQIVKNYITGEAKAKVEERMENSQRAVKMFGDKTVRDFYAAIDNPRGAEMNVLGGTIQGFIGKHLVDSKVGSGDAEDSLKLLKQNPKILQDTIAFCEGEIKKVDYQKLNKIDRQFRKDYINYKISLLKQIQQGLAR